MKKGKYLFRRVMPDIEAELKKSSKFRIAFDIQTAKLRLAHKLAEIREKADLTQAQLAKKMGVSQQLVSRIESGSDNLTLETLIKFLDLFGVSMTIHFEKRKNQQVLEFA